MPDYTDNLLLCYLEYQIVWTTSYYVIFDARLYRQPVTMLSWMPDCIGNQPPPLQATHLVLFSLSPPPTLCLCQRSLQPYSSLKPKVVLCATSFYPHGVSCYCISMIYDWIRHFLTHKTNKIHRNMVSIALFGVDSAWIIITIFCLISTSPPCCTSKFVNMKPTCCHIWSYL